MKNSPYFLIALLFFSCSKDESTVDRKSVLETALGVEASTSPFGGDELFYADVVYGSGSRNHLDIILPQSTDPKGVVLFFHGGVLQRGVKKMLMRLF